MLQTAELFSAAFLFAFSRLFLALRLQLLHNFHGNFAHDLFDLVFQAADAGFPCISIDDGTERFVGNLHLCGFKAHGFAVARNQIFFGDLHFSCMM